MRENAGDAFAIDIWETVMKKEQAKGRGKKVKGKGKESHGVYRVGKDQEGHGILENNLGDTAFPGPLQG
jgi:hypothetical protein